MKQLNSIIIVCLSLLLAACAQEEEARDQAPGYLSISGITLTSEGEKLPLTKAVDEALRIEVWQNGEVVTGQSFDAGNVPDRITLSPGVYILKALSTHYYEATPNGEKGEPAYYNESPFTITKGDLVTIKLVVPMRNVGVKFAPSEEFKRIFPTFTIKIETTSRTYTFNETNYAEAAYFNTPQSGSLNYIITAKNTDDETVGPLQKSIKVKSGTIYSLAMSIE